jgi:hypothetical protein
MKVLTAKLRFVLLLISVLAGCTNSAPSKKTTSTEKDNQHTLLCLGYQSGWSEARSKQHTDSLKKAGIITRGYEQLSQPDERIYFSEFNETVLFDISYKTLLTHCAIGEKQEQLLFKITLIQEPMSRYYSALETTSFQQFRAKIHKSRIDLFTEIVNKYQAKIINPYECYIDDSVVVRIKIDSVTTSQLIDPNKKGIDQILSQNKTKRVQGTGMRIVVEYIDLKLYDRYVKESRARANSNKQRHILESKEKL